MSDLIKREDAIKAVWSPQVRPNALIFDALKRAIESGINNIPSADRPQGEWMSKCGNKVCTCSSCGEDYDHTYEWIEKWNFCPNCGARMKGADDED